jgi:hypothetical protein
MHYLAAVDSGLAYRWLAERSFPPPRRHGALLRQAPTTPPAAQAPSSGRRGFTSPLLFKGWRECDEVVIVDQRLFPTRLAQKAEHDLCIAVGLDDGQEVASAVEQDQTRSRNRLRQGA